MLQEQKRTWAEISRSALRNNCKSIRAQLPPECGLMGVVKANGYGHGAAEVARQAEQAGCVYLGVACVDEAVSLRKKGVTMPILILGYSQGEYVEMLSDLNITQAVGSLQAAQEYSNFITAAGKKLKVHLKLETGMGRTGIDVKQGELQQAVAALSLPGLDYEGVFTHFAVSDEVEKQEYTAHQFSCFCQAVERLQELTGISFKIKHCANSGAVINYPQYHMDMVRPGLAFYGVYPCRRQGEPELVPVMSLKSRIAAITHHPAGESISYGCTFTAQRDTVLAVLPIGYADGLHRCLSGKLEVSINGRRAKQVGRICMDMCMIDITDLPDVEVGDVATVFGRDDFSGQVVVSVDEQAEKVDTISYELLCAVSERVPRCYVD